MIKWMMGACACMFAVPAMAAEGCKLHEQSSTLVCVEVVEEFLRCREAGDSDYYEQCDVVVEYDVSADFEGDGMLDADVRCELTIEYNGDGISYAKTKREASIAPHNIYALGGGREELSFQFRFLSFEQVNNVRVRNLACDVDDVVQY